MHLPLWTIQLVAMYDEIKNTSIPTKEATKVYFQHKNFPVLNKASLGFCDPGELNDLEVCCFYN